LLGAWYSGDDDQGWELSQINNGVDEMVSRWLQQHGMFTTSLVMMSGHKKMFNPRKMDGQSASDRWQDRVRRLKDGGREME